MGHFSMQTVFENSLMQHHVALPPGSMGKITYIAPAGQYNLKVCLLTKLILHLNRHLWCHHHNNSCLISTSIKKTELKGCNTLSFLWKTGILMVMGSYC